jgi:hypothetical protein
MWKARWRLKESAMPITNILILTVVVSAFVVFAVALAWGEYQTRNINRRDQRVPRKSGREQTYLAKDADQGAGHRDTVNAVGGAMNEAMKWAPTKAERTAAHFG